MTVLLLQFFFAYASTVSYVAFVLSPFLPYLSFFSSKGGLCFVLMAFPGYLNLYFPVCFFCTAKPFWKRVYCKRKAFAPTRSSFFPFRIYLFLDRINLSVPHPQHDSVPLTFHVCCLAHQVLTKSGLLGGKIILTELSPQKVYTFLFSWVECATIY